MDGKTVNDPNTQRVLARRDPGIRHVPSPSIKSILRTCALLAVLPTAHATVEDGLIAYYRLEGDGKQSALPKVDKGQLWQALGQEGEVKGAQPTKNMRQINNKAMEFMGKEHIDLTINSMAVHDSDYSVSAWVLVKKPATTTNTNSASATSDADASKTPDASDSKSKENRGVIFSTGDADCKQKGFSIGVFGKDRENVYMRNFYKDKCIELKTQDVPPAGIHDGQWHHIVGTVSTKSGANLYVDANSKDTKNDNGGVDLSMTTHAKIGANAIGSSEFFTGSIAELRIYKKALNEREVGELNKDYKTGNPLEVDGFGYKLPYIEDQKIIKLKPIEITTNAPGLVTVKLSIQDLGAGEFVLMKRDGIDEMMDYSKGELTLKGNAHTLKNRCADIQFKFNDLYYKTFKISVRVDDGTNEPVNGEITLIGTHVNHAPQVMKPLGIKRFRPEEEIFIDISKHFKDKDGNPLEYAATVGGGHRLPPWLAINKNTGVMEGVGPPGQEVSYRIKVIATDPAKESSEISFNLVVSSNNNEVIKEEIISTIENEASSMKRGHKEEDEGTFHTLAYQGFISLLGVLGILYCIRVMRNINHQRRQREISTTSSSSESSTTPMTQQTPTSTE